MVEYFKILNEILGNLWKSVKQFLTIPEKLINFVIDFIQLFPYGQIIVLVLLVLLVLIVVDLARGV